jgi:hypothetical protein
VVSQKRTFFQRRHRHRPLGMIHENQPLRRVNAQNRAKTEIKPLY